MLSFAYVTNVGSRSISVIDVATNTVATNITIGGAPTRIAVTPNGSRAYTTIRANNRGFVAVLNTTNQTLAHEFVLTDFFIGGVAVTPDGMLAYIANSGNDHMVRVLDTQTNSVVAEVAMDLSIDVCISPDGTHAYASSFDGVAVIDTATNTVEATINVDKPSTGTTGRGVAITPDGATGYLTTGGDNSVAVFDTTTNSVTATIDVGTDPVGVAISPTGSRVYVTNHGSGDVSVIDTATKAVTATIAVGDAPFGVALTPGGGHALVTNSGPQSNSVSVIDTSTDSVVAEVAVGTQPFGIAISG